MSHGVPAEKEFDEFLRTQLARQREATAHLMAFFQAQIGNPGSLDGAADLVWGSVASAYPVTAEDIIRAEAEQAQAPKVSQTDDLIASQYRTVAGLERSATRPRAHSADDAKSAFTPESE